MVKRSREPSRYYLTRTRNQNTISLVVILNHDSLVLLRQVRRLSLDLRRSVRREGDRCSRRRSAPRSCSGNSLVEAWVEGRLVVDRSAASVRITHQTICFQRLTIWIGGNGFVFNMNGGGPGVRIHQMGGGVPRRRPHNHANQEPASPLAALQSLLPLLLLFIVPLLSSLFSGSAPTYPSVRYDNPLPPQTLHHVSSKLKVDYYVNPVEINDYTPSKWKNLDKYVEQRYVQRLSSDCEWQMAQRQRAFQEAQGFWSRDEEKWERATNMGMPACKKLEGWGYRIAY